MKTVASFMPASGRQPTDSVLASSLSEYTCQIESTDLKRIIYSFNSLSEDDKEWISKAHEKLGIKNDLISSIRNGVEKNQTFLDSIAFTVKTWNCGNVTHLPSRIRALPIVAAREWSTDLSTERNAVYGPIIEAVKSHVLSGGRILIPGVSACRLAYDLCACGYSVVGIEHDLLRLALAEFVFTQNTAILNPFVLETCNRLKASDNVTDISIPDIAIDPLVLERMSINSNDFFSAAPEYPSASFDCIVTCFFIDCESVDIAEFVRECKRLLTPGGVWINCGPLNYHYGGSEIRRSVPRRELPLAEIKSMITSAGFTITDESEISSTYLGNPKTIMETRYKCQFLVAKNF